MNDSAWQRLYLAEQALQAIEKKMAVPQLAASMVGSLTEIMEKYRQDMDLPVNTKIRDHLANYWIDLDPQLSAETGILTYMSKKASCLYCGQIFYEREVLIEPFWNTRINHAQQKHFIKFPKCGAKHAETNLRLNQKPPS